jgi:hypothetical protein
LGLLKRAVRRFATRGQHVLSVFGAKTKKIFSKKFLKILQGCWSLLFRGCLQDPVSLYLKYLWFEKKKRQFKDYKAFAIRKSKKAFIVEISPKLQVAVKKEFPKHPKGYLVGYLHTLMASVKVVKNPLKALFFQKRVNLILNRRIPF